MITISALEFKRQLRSVEAGVEGGLHHLLAVLKNDSSFARFFSNLPIASVQCGNEFELFAAEGGDIIESMLTVNDADIETPEGSVEIKRHEDGEISIDCGFEFGVIFSGKQAEELIIAMQKFVAAAPP
ncbi:MAG: hypothetical protein O3A36_01425 [bacterium]|nr:hypothetical protein [bacterium]